MTRRGYYSEDKIKKMLKKQYPDSDIIRNQIADFMVIQNGKIIKIVEVKSIHQNKYYPTPREKRQILRIIEFSIKHNIGSEIWIDKIGKGIEIKTLIFR